MNTIDTFDKFAAAFEAAVEDDNWTRLKPYLAEDATYLNVGGPDPRCKGREEIIAFLKEDVANTDRRFDKRILIALSPPIVEGSRLTRQWRCTYSLTEAPDLVVEGEARYLFENGLIKEIEEEVTSDAMQNIDRWMENYGDKLHARQAH